MNALKISTNNFYLQVFSRLWYPIVRQGALTVLSHMLLSFQHSPEAFHLVRDLRSPHCPFPSHVAALLAWLIFFSLGLYYFKTAQFSF